MKSGTRTPRPGLAVKIVTAMLSVAIALVVGEATYRAYLYRTEPHHFLGDRSLWYLEKSPFRFSEEFGYEYIPGSYNGGAIYEGKVTDCFEPFTEWVINERGNSGRIRGSYEDAELKILAFGDSVTQRPRRAPDGSYMTWPNYLQDALERDLGQSVHVVNFGRDGYGVLQMFDLVAAKVREWKPDLAIIAFITDDLTRDRFWRTHTVVDGRERILVSEVPDPTPGWDVASEAYLVHSGATSEWCHRLLESGEADDPIALELEQALREGRRRSTLLADPWSLSQSFLVDRILRGNAYHTTYAAARPSEMPRHELRDFAEDERLPDAVRALRETGVPYVLVHLALPRELEAEQEYASSDNTGKKSALVASLGRLTGLTVHGTFEHVDLPVDDPAGLAFNFPEDRHPSLRGHEFYGEMVAGLLQRHRYVSSAHPAARQGTD